MTALASASLWRGIAAILLVAVVAVMAWAINRTPRSQGQSFLEHVEELRRRILVAGAAVVATTAFLFSFDWPAHSYYPVPALHDNLAARLFGKVRTDLVPEDVLLVVARPMDGFGAELAISFGFAMILMAPIVIWQLGGFVWPGLKKNEQRILLQAFLPVLLLFLAGASFAYVVVLPFLLETLYAYGSALGAQGLLPVSEFVSFVLGMVLVMGIAFQTPMIMWVLTRTGVVSGGFWAKQWRYAVVGIMVLSALVTDPTIVSQAMVAAPLLLLYGLGVILALSAQRFRAASSIRP